MILLKLLLFVLLLKAVWLILAGLAFLLFSGAVIAIIAGRSLREKMLSRPNDFRLPR